VSTETKTTTKRKTKKHLVIHVLEDHTLRIVEQTHRVKKFGRKEDDQNEYYSGVFFVSSTGFLLSSSV
jgi:hypothetical protein